MTIRFFSLLALAAVLVLAAGCTGSEQAANTGPETTLEVDNRNFLDMNVYVLRSGQRVRVGRVGGNSRRTFTIPDYVVTGSSDLQFLVDPVGSGNTPRTYPLQVVPGESVRLVIPSNL
jgi:hypothetical protein